MERRKPKHARRSKESMKENEGVVSAQVSSMLED